MFRQIIFGLIVLLTSLFFISISCDRDSPTESNKTLLAKVSGDGQSGAPGDTLSTPLVVLVTDSKGRAISGQWLDLSIIEGNASLSDTLAVTNEIGKAETKLILGDSEGEIRVEVKLRNTDIKTFFTAYASNLPPYSIAIVSGNNQSGDPGYELPDALQVVVKNERGQPTPGTIVTFSITEGAGTLSALSDTTNSSGIAQTNLTLGDLVGINQVTASVYSLTPVIFTATALPPIVDMKGFSQEGLSGEMLSNPLQVIVRNNQGYPLEGIQVTFSITEGIGTLSISETNTSILGIAETWLTLGPAIGTIQVTAMVSGIETPKVFKVFSVESLSSKSKIIFSSDRDGPEFDGYGRNSTDIFIMNDNGTNPVNITNSPMEWDSQPSWSPDGSKIVFRSTRDGDADIFIMNADGSNPINLTNKPNETYNYPSWSPDGTKIAFMSSDYPGYEIYIMNADGSNKVKITDYNIMSCYETSWSSDGKKIAVSTYIGNKSDIYIINIDGSNPVNITNNSEHVGEPAWSPDGSQIAFVSGMDVNRKICVMNSDGSNQVSITDDSSYNRSPSWSPDGIKIVFTSNREGNYDIYIMNTDGTNPVNLTNSPDVNESSPSWSPILNQ